MLRSIIKRQTSSTKGTTSWRADTKSAQTSSTNGQMSGRTSAASGQTNTTSGKASTMSL